MRYRKLSASGDRVFGHGQADFWVNQREGVGQAVLTRLELWKGQWFLNVADGMPWATEVLGKYTDSLRDMAVQDRIYATPGVTQINGYNSELDRQSRAWTAHADISTLYGQITIAGPI